MSVMTLTKIETATRMMVKSRYLPIRGITRLVGGMRSMSTKKKMVNVTRILIANVILCPLKGI